MITNNVYWQLVVDSEFSAHSDNAKLTNGSINEADQSKRPDIGAAILVYLVSRRYRSDVLVQTFWP